MMQKDIGEWPPRSQVLFGTYDFNLFPYNYVC